MSHPITDHPIRGATGGAITGVSQIHVSVQDIDAAVAFYHEVLGLPLMFAVPEQQMAFLDAGDLRIYLGRAESEEYRSRPLIYFRVDDLHVYYQAVTARGATALAAPHVVHRDEVVELWVAFVADPEGTPIGLMQEIGSRVR
jgi:predicted enzyme related to lactoylglutathione lyase